MCDSLPSLSNPVIRPHIAINKIDLQTKRLNLRVVKSKDATELARLADDYRIADMMNGSIPHPYTIEHANAWIEKHLNDSSLTQAISWAITEKENDLFIGSIQLRIDDARKTARLSYWIGLPYWNKGFATEAGNKIIQYGFMELGLMQIDAEHFGRNPASGKVLNKLGFQFFGTVIKKENLKNRQEEFHQYYLKRAD